MPLTDPQTTARGKLTVRRYVATFTQNWRMMSSAIWRCHVVLWRTDVSEERVASIFKARASGSPSFAAKLYHTTDGEESLLPRHLHCCVCYPGDTRIVDKPLLRRIWSLALIEDNNVKFDVFAVVTIMDAVFWIWRHAVIGRTDVSEEHFTERYSLMHSCKHANETMSVRQLHLLVVPVGNA
jgi:hypothetical protein